MTQLDSETISALKNAILLTINSLNCVKHPLEVAIALEATASEIRAKVATLPSTDPSHENFILNETPNSRVSSSLV